jgi:hypothetical protein
VLHHHAESTGADMGVPKIVCPLGRGIDVVLDDVSVELDAM